MTKAGRTTTRPGVEEALLRRVHAGLLVLLAACLGVWLWRTYGFAPLRIVEAGR